MATTRSPAEGFLSSTPIRVLRRWAPCGTEVRLLDCSRFVGDLDLGYRDLEPARLLNAMSIPRSYEGCARFRLATIPPSPMIQACRKTTVEQRSASSRTFLTIVSREGVGRSCRQRAVSRRDRAVDHVPAAAVDFPVEERAWPRPRSQEGRLLLLRRYLCAGTAVLRVSYRGRISCAGAMIVTEAKPQDRASTVP
jgi:hypothetical protein